MSKKLVTIVHVDLTDVPPARSVCNQFLVDVIDTDSFAAQLKTLKRAVRKHSDGNDEQYRVNITDPDEVETLTQAGFVEFVDKFTANLRGS